jgi:copper homeostasis protein
VTVLLEAAVETLDAALAAAEGGVHRLELCADLAHAGTTPDRQLLRACRAQLSIPSFVLVRPRPGDFVYSTTEHRVMLDQIQQAKDAGADGIVAGVLNTTNAIAEDRTAELLAAVRPLRFTFHRAFDACQDRAAALARLIALGVDRVLTSGGAATAPQGAEQIGRLVAQARGRIAILAGGGIDGGNVAKLVRDADVHEVHFSVREAEKVRSVVRALAQPHSERSL